MKWFLLIVLLVVGWFFFLRKSVTQKDIQESAPVKYTESLRQSEQKAEATADQANQMILQTAVQSYQAAKGEFPASLDVLVQEGYLQAVPSGNWHYNNQTGEVR